MSIITREQLRERARNKVKTLEFIISKNAFTNKRAEQEEELELARIALASLEAEAVAPGDVTGPLAHAYKELTPTFMRNHIGVFERYGIYPDGSTGIRAMRIALDGMERRAAMLQGAAGNSPDGWVACSERMPTENDIVLVVDDGYFVCEAQHREGDFYSAVRGNGEFFETTCRDVEFWQPLPAAPQQEVKS